jgi:hypothetical protein
VAIVLSALVHAAVLSKWLPEIRFTSPGELEQRALVPPLVVNLAPPRIIPPAPPPALPPAPRAKPRPPIEAPTPPRAAPVIALNRPAPKAPPPAAEPPAPPAHAAPKPRPDFDDLASYVEARRRARAASGPAAPPDRPASIPVEDENTHAGRVVAQNLGSEERLSFGYDPDRSGGLFQMQLLGYDYAEFTFIGWNKDIRRTTKQLVEVRRGDNSDIRVAVIRRMIAIIREQVQEEDFLWDSQHLGYRTLSARVKDNKALEEFLMGEFFGGAGPPPARP